MIAALVLAAVTGPGIRTFVVDRETTGVLVEDHRVPLVAVVLEFPAGTWSPWVRRAGAADAFEMQMHDPGGALRRRADALALAISFSAGRRASVLRVTCLKESLDGALALVRDVLANRRFDRAELAARRRTRKIEWEASLKEPGSVLDRAVARRLFGPVDPRRLDHEPPPKGSADVPALADARDALIRLAGRVVGFAGDLTPAEAESAAAGLLPPPGDSAPPDLAPRLGAIAPPADEVVPVPRLTQTYFALYRDAPGWTDPDAAALRIADHVLGGHFYSRLETALRHEGGETYGASTRSWAGAAPGAYELFTYTRSANASATEAKLREVLRLFHERGISADERAAAAGFLLGRRAFERRSPERILDRWLTERLAGLPEGGLDALDAAAAALPLEDVNAFIRRFYDPSRFALARATAR